MEYQDYTVEDFVLNSRFRKWLVNPSKEDNLFWEEYIRNHLEQLPVIEQAKKILVSLPKEKHVLESKEKEDIWNEIIRNAEADQLGKTPDERGVIPMNSEVILKKASYSDTKKKTGKHLTKLLIAASVVFVLSTTFFFSKSLMDREDWNLTQLNERVTKSNPWGQKSTVFMVDGTEVILNSGSSITYNKEFENDKREVYLEGEAFFKVAKDPLRPFQVITGNIVTQALGTSFNVNFYSPERISVSLVTGKVQVTHSNEGSEPMEEMILEPGEQANFISSENQFKKGKFKIKEICSWKDGVIYFQDAGSGEVFSYLEKWYGVKIIEVNEPLEKWNYTGEFDNLDLYNVLNSIGFAMNFEFTKEDKTYRIHYQK